MFSALDSPVPNGHLVPSQECSACSKTTEFIPYQCLSWLWVGLCRWVVLPVCVLTADSVSRAPQTASHLGVCWYCSDLFFNFWVVLSVQLFLGHFSLSLNSWMMLIIPFVPLFSPPWRAETLIAYCATTTNIRLKDNAESLGLEMGPCSVAQHDWRKI